MPCVRAGKKIPSTLSPLIGERKWAEKEEKEGKAFKCWERCIYRKLGLAEKNRYIFKDSFYLDSPLLLLFCMFSHKLDYSGSEFLNSWPNLNNSSSNAISDLLPSPFLLFSFSFFASAPIPRIIVLLKACMPCRNFASGISKKRKGKMQFPFPSVPIGHTTPQNGPPISMQFPQL